MDMGADSGLRIMQKAWDRAHNVQEKRNEIYQRQWQRYKGYSTAVSDPYRSNLTFPKLYTAIETITPRISKALFGKRPYVPIKSDISPDQADYIETVLDNYLYKDKFKIKGGQLVKAIALFGTVFIEPIPSRKIITEKQMIQSPVYPWQPMVTEAQIPRFRLDNRVYMPWQVYVEPRMTTLNDPGYVIIVELVPRKEIERLADMGRYPNVDKDKLKGWGEREDKIFSEKMLSSLNIERPTDDQDYGVLMRYQSDERYITVWNGTVLLEDAGNPYKHKEINLVRCAWNYDPMLQNSFWGQPEGKAVEGILDKLDESWNMTFDNHDLINQGVIAYQDGAVETEHLIMVGGARIPVKGNFGRPVSEAVSLLNTQGLPPDAYNIPYVLDLEVDRSIGNYAPNRGEPTKGETTATEASLLSQSGDLRNEFRAEMMENLGLADFADRCTSHIDQFATIDDLHEIIGPAAMLVATMNPQMVSGGAEYQFKGSDTITNDFQRRADFREQQQILQNNSAVYQDMLARKSLELIGWNQQEVDELVMPHEMYTQMMIMQAMAGVQPPGHGSITKQNAATPPTAGNPRG